MSDINEEVSLVSSNLKKPARLVVVLVKSLPTNAQIAVEKAIVERKKISTSKYMAELIPASKSSFLDMGKEALMVAAMATY